LFIRIKGRGIGNKVGYEQAIREILQDDKRGRGGSVGDMGKELVEGLCGAIGG